MFIKAAVIDFFCCWATWRQWNKLLTQYWHIGVLLEKHFVYLFTFLGAHSSSHCLKVSFLWFSMWFIRCAGAPGYMKNKGTPVQPMCKVTSVFCFLITPEGYTSLSFAAKHSTMFSSWLPDRLSAIRCRAKKCKGSFLTACFAVWAVEKEIGLKRVIRVN